MSALRAVALTTVASAGCYLEGTVGVTPSMSQSLTGTDGATMESSRQAWTVALRTGFYFDVPHGGLGYSSWGTNSITSTPGTANVKTSGRHLRVDVDFPGDIGLRVTGSYASVGDTDVDATGVTTATNFPTQPNGKISALQAKGSTWFAGLTFETKPRRWLSVQGTLGLAWSSVTTELSVTDVTTPAVSQSGTGIQARVMVMFGSDVGIEVFRPPTPEEAERHRQEQQMLCGQDQCHSPTAADYKSTTSPGLDPIKPLPSTSSGAGCHDSNGNPISCESTVTHH